MQLNLSNKADEIKPQYFVAISDDGEIESSKEEMLQIIESMRTEIKYLTKKVKTLTVEKDQLTDNFKMSSGILLDRLKDLEMIKNSALAQNIDEFSGERPETANVLSKICKLRIFIIWWIAILIVVCIKFV